MLHCPGHTPGLTAMFVHLEKDGTMLFTTDMYHVKANWEGIPQGWLSRDHGTLALV
jgi:glyoxylase-like metal-dependent hydrolase (beta-lactamase superfamily II)